MQKHWKTHGKCRFFNEGKLSTYAHRRKASCHWGRLKALENLRKMFAEEDMNDQVRNIQNDWDRQHAGYDMGGAPRGPMNNEMHGG